MSRPLIVWTIFSSSSAQEPDEGADLTFWNDHHSHPSYQPFRLRVNMPTVYASSHGPAKRFGTTIEAQRIKEKHHDYDHPYMRERLAPAWKGSTAAPRRWPMSSD